MTLRDDAKKAGLSWCDPDDCPSAICGGPHILYVHLLTGDELVQRFDIEIPIEYAPPPDNYVPIKDR